MLVSALCRYSGQLKTLALTSGAPVERPRIYNIWSQQNGKYSRVAYGLMICSASSAVIPY